MDFGKLVRDFQYKNVERPLTSWGQHEEAMIALLKEVFDAGKKEGIDESPQSSYSYCEED